MEKTLTLGRSKENHIELISTKISKSHAKIDYKNGKLILSDLGSSNGTFVNGKKIKQKYLSPGDKISIGGACELQISGTFGGGGKIKQDETIGDLLNDVQTYEGDLDVTNMFEEKTEHLTQRKDKKAKTKEASKLKTLLLVIILAGVGYLALDFVGDSTQETTGTQSGTKEGVSDIRAVAPYKDKFLKKKIDFKKIREGDVKSKAQIEAERLFVHGKQVYLSNRFHDAINVFREVLLFDKGHTMGRVYLERAQAELQKLIDLHDKQGRDLYSNLRYHQAAIEFKAVMNLLRNKKTDPRYRDAKQYLNDIKRKTKRY